jgi:hypothetical protein
MVEEFPYPHQEQVVQDVLAGVSEGFKLNRPWVGFPITLDKYELFISKKYAYQNISKVTGLGYYSI